MCVCVCVCARARARPQALACIAKAMESSQQLASDSRLLSTLGIVDAMLGHLALLESALLQGRHDMAVQLCKQYPKAAEKPLK